MEPLPPLPHHDHPMFSSHDESNHPLSIDVLISTLNNETVDHEQALPSLETEDPFRCASDEPDPDTMSITTSLNTMLPLPVGDTSVLSSVVVEELPSVHMLWDDCYATFDNYPTPASAQRTAIDPRSYQAKHHDIRPGSNLSAVSAESPVPLLEVTNSNCQSRRIVDESDHGYFGKKKSKGSFKYIYDKWWTCWALILVVLVSTIVGIHLFVLETDEGSAAKTKSVDVATTAASPTSPPYMMEQVTTSPPKSVEAKDRQSPATEAHETKAPRSTTVPTMAPVIDGRIQSVVRAAAREPNLLEVPTSWPARAVSWLQTANLAPLSSSLHIRQRYALVVLDMALHNATTPRIAKPLSDECSWSGITCHSPPITGNNTKPRGLRRFVTSIQWNGFDLIGSMPEDVALLTRLTKLDLSDNRIVGSLPLGMYNLSNLQYLHLNSNFIEGTIATHVGKMTQLVRVRLNDNQLRGSIPVELGSSSHDVKPIEWISLRNNTLSGSLPSLNSHNLIHLDLGRNNITGTIPTKWVEGEGSMQGLRSLRLDYNLLTGSLPKQWSNLGNGLMNQIDLNDNQLTGEVPGRYKNKTALVALHVQNNMFDKLSKDICEMSSMDKGSLEEFIADCDICTCDLLCGTCHL